MKCLSNEKRHFFIYTRSKYIYVNDMISLYDGLTNAISTDIILNRYKNSLLVVQVPVSARI